MYGERGCFDNSFWKSTTAEDKSYDVSIATDYTIVKRKGVWPGILAILIQGGINGFPVQVPGVAAVEAIQGHEGVGVGFAPASARAFETLGRGLALGLLLPMVFCCVVFGLLFGGLIYFAVQHGGRF